MEINEILNLIGLFFITVGSILAALGTPSPQYQPDGSVRVSGEPDLEKRKKIYRWQKNLPRFLLLIGLGALIQAIAIICT